MDNSSVVDGCNCSRVYPHEHLFANDCARNATTGGDTQRSMNLLAHTSDNFVLIMNMEKRVAMHQVPSNTAYVAPHMNVDAAKLEAMDTFT
ncbi:hypothetical protein SprV_0802478200 [Sparganum proliferum]